jgi:HPC2 and ubinuclein domain
MPSTSLPGPQLIKPSRNSYPAPPLTTLAPTSNGLIMAVPMHSSRVEEPEQPKVKKAENGSAPSSAAPTPPPKQKFREPPPLPTGSGLLSGTPWGGISSGPEGSSVPKGTNIWLTFALKGKENVTINFSHEVETKYGLSALNPRLAARKERQRQVALASSELEKVAGLAGSTDDMSIDASEPESNNDTDVVMKDAEAPAPGKRRKRKAEDYDRNDDFIDDEELLLEEQALMAKDGFFVYSGPLVEEGERPTIERFVFVELLMPASLISSTEPMELFEEVVAVVVVELLVAKHPDEDLEEVVADLAAAPRFVSLASPRQIEQ